MAGVQLTQMREFLADLTDRRDPITVGGNAPRLVIELYGGNMVEMTAFQPDPATYRESFYYNTAINVLYKRVVTDNNPAGVVAHWQKVSL